MFLTQSDWCLDMVLDIIHEILTQFNEVVKSRESEIAK
jgi:hypothetical protein